MAGALGSVELAVAAWWPGFMLHEPTAWLTDGALLVTGIGLIARQPNHWTGPLCLGFMTSKALVLTLAVVMGGVNARVPWALTLLILFYMAGVLAGARVWWLAIDAIVVGLLTWLGPASWASAMAGLWFLGIGRWIAPWPPWCSRRGG